MSVETRERHCPVCGRDVTTEEFKRFGEFACSEEHAVAYVDEVRGRKQAAAAGQSRPVPGEPAGRRRGGCC